MCDGVVSSLPDLIRSIVEIVRVHDLIPVSSTLAELAGVGIARTIILDIVRGELREVADGAGRVSAIE